MEREVLTHEFFKQITSPLMYTSFIHQYERKTLVIGLSQALSADTLPPAMQEHMLGIFKVIIETMNKLKEQEAKALRKAGKKEITLNSRDEDERNGGSDDDDYEDDSEDGDEDDGEESDEEDMEHDGGPTVGGKEGGNKKDDEEFESAGSGQEDEQEEQDGGPEDGLHAKNGGEETKFGESTNPGGLGFVSDEEEDDNNDDDPEDDDDNAFDLNLTMDMLNAPFKRADEFDIFNK